MPKLKLSYFDFHGGRGEPARVALSIAAIPFEDDRVVFKDWAARKPTTPFGSLPLLEVDGKVLTQSNAINRYVGRLAGLYPEDPWQAALADEVSEAAEEYNNALGTTMGLSGDALKAAREKLAETKLTPWLRATDRLLTQAGGEWFADGRLTMADLKVADVVRHTTSGKLDHVPADLVERIAPNLVAHFNRVRAHPGVAAYYARFNS